MYQKVVEMIYQGLEIFAINPAMMVHYLKWFVSIPFIISFSRFATQFSLCNFLS